MSDSATTTKVQDETLAELQSSIQSRKHFGVQCISDDDDLYGLYRGVLESRGDFDPERQHLEADRCGCFGSGYLDDAELALRRDMYRIPLKMAYYGEGSGWRDWRIHMANKHPGAACCCSSDMHPVSRTERWYITAISLLFALTLSAMSTETEQCYLWDLSADCLTTTMYNHTKLYPKARANAAARSGKSLGGGSAALNAPGAEFCCEMSNPASLRSTTKLEALRWLLMPRLSWCCSTFSANSWQHAVRTSPLEATCI